MKLKVEMLKKVTINLIFLFFVNIVVGQTDKIKKLLFEPKETDSLYIKAIHNYLKELETYSIESTHQEDILKTIYIQDRNYLSKIPKSINGYEIIQIGLANRRKYFRKNKNRLYLIEISPLTIKDGLFEITLVPYSARLKGKKLYLEYNHWNTTYFSYENGKLVFKKFETGGI